MIVLDKLSSSVLKGVGNYLSPAGPKSSLAILIYHRVLPKPDPVRPGDITADIFDWQMAILAKSFNVLPLSQAVERLRNGTLPSRAVCITFDDGYADNHSVAMPILKKWRLSATFFIAVGFLDGGRMWNDTIIESISRAPDLELDLTDIGLGRHVLSDMQTRHKAIASIISSLKYLGLQERVDTANRIAFQIGVDLPDDLMMSSSQVCDMAKNGMEIGAHTVNHPILNKVSDADAEREIKESRDRLQEILNGKIVSFAYPNGRPGIDYSQRHAEMIRQAGFSHCVSTAWGCAKQNADIWQLPRISPWDPTPLRFAARILRSYAGGQGEVAMQ